MLLLENMSINNFSSLTNAAQLTWGKSSIAYLYYRKTYSISTASADVTAVAYGLFHIPETPEANLSEERLITNLKPPRDLGLSLLIVGVICHTGSQITSRRYYNSSLTTSDPIGIHNFFTTLASFNNAFVITYYQRGVHCHLLLPAARGLGGTGMGS